MGSYVQQTLINGETIRGEAKISIWSMVPILIVAGFFLLLALVLILSFEPASMFFGLIWGGFAGVLLLIAYIRYKTTELAVTNKRVIAKFGFISRSTIEISLGKVESVQVHQGLLGRIFNYGSLIVSGGGNPQAPIPGIASPMEFRRIAMETVSELGTGK